MLVEPTAEGKIVFALLEGPKSYTELKRCSGLSDRWLTLKLKNLARQNIIEIYDKKYRLLKPRIIFKDPFATGFLKAAGSHLGKAKLIAEELSQNPEVLGVVLFGSVATGSFTSESDIDLLIVVKKKELNDEVYELMFKYDVPVEPIFMTFDDFLSNARERSSLLMGVLRGYEILYDGVGIGNILYFLGRELMERFIYDEEAGAWIRKK